ncbi:MAG: ABC transporter permease [Oscillospiraceae bacterium]|nr:ABC transporter permease [Oscillospiraceae bacterium]
MKYNIFFKSTLRQPLRTILLFLVIGAVTFMMVSRATEYFTLKRETDSLSSYYRSIARLEVTGNTYDTPSAVEYLEANQYVDYVDWYRYTSGVAKGDIYNMHYFKGTADFGFADSVEMGFYNSDVFFYGKFIKVGESKMRKRELTFSVDSLLVGYPEYLKVGAEYTFTVSDEVFTELLNLTLKERYLVRARYYFSNNSGNYRFDSSNDINLDLVPLNENGEWFIHAPLDLDFDDPVYSELNKIMRVTDDNEHAFGVIATKDMTILPRMQEVSQQYYLAEGRMINYDDYLENRKVCVIYTEIAEKYGLNIGDTFELELRNLMYVDYGGYLANKIDFDNVGKYEVATETYEIVGIFGAAKHYDSDENKIYIPLSAVPDNFEPESYYDEPNLITVLLNSPKNTDEFIAETKDALAEYGVRTVFIEMGYENFVRMVTPMLNSSLINAAIYSCISVLVLAIAVFVYFRSRRKDFAISRAMGTPKGKCAIGSALPLMVIGILSTLLGGILAWRYTTHSIQNTLTKFSELGLEIANTALRLTTPMIIAAIVFAVFVISAGIGAFMLAKRPVLELIQGEVKTHGK